MSPKFQKNALIIGAGPIGAMIGATLIKAGYNVTFAGRPNSSYTQYICNHGLEVCYPSGEVFTISPRQTNIHFTDTSCELNCKFSLIIIAVKNNNLSKLSSYIYHHSNSNSILIHAQNGIPYWWFNDRDYTSNLNINFRAKLQKQKYLDSVDPKGKILDLLSERNIVGCIIKAPSSKSDFGVIDIKKTPKCILGLTKGEDYTEANLSKLSELCDQLTLNGLLAQHSRNIRAEVCKKLSVNITVNTLVALTSKNTSSLIENAFSKDLIVHMFKEANEIFKAFNIAEKDLSTLQELFTYIEEPGSRKHIPSLAYDFSKRQIGEINLIEAPVEMANIAGIKVPVLESVSELLKAGQKFALSGECEDTNLLQLNPKKNKLILNPNVYRSTTLNKFRIANLLAHISKLNLNSRSNYQLIQQLKRVLVVN